MRSHIASTCTESVAQIAFVSCWGAVNIGNGRQSIVRASGNVPWLEYTTEESDLAFLRIFPAFSLPISVLVLAYPRLPRRKPRGEDTMHVPFLIPWTLLSPCQFGFLDNGCRTNSKRIRASIMLYYFSIVPAEWCPFAMWRCLLSRV